MERVVYDCDKCGAQAVHTDRFAVVVDRRMDAAGSSEDIQFLFDLCPRCTALLLRDYLRGMDMETGWQWGKKHLPTHWRRELGWLEDR